MRTSALSFILLASCACAFALDPSLDVSQYAHTSWKVRDGFTRGGIISIAQTPDGYLWLGTEFGLVRFDGVRTVPWEPPEGQSLPGDTIYNLLVARDGTLWIGTTKGLASWKGNTLARYRDLDGLAVNSLLEDRDGTLWAGLGGAIGLGKLCAFRNGSVECFGKDGRFGYALEALYQDKSGNLWAGVADGLWRWKPGPPKFYSLPGNRDGIQAISEDNDGSLLVGWKDGIYRFIDGKTEPYLTPGISRKLQIKSILRDRNGALWIGTEDYGLVHIHNGKSDTFSASDGLSGDYAYRLFEDREGNIWVATVVDGLDRFRDYAVPTFRTQQGLSRNLVGSVQADKDGSVWFATFGGLNRWNGGQITIPQLGSGALDGTIHGSHPTSLFQDDRGRIWLATSHEFGYLENGHFTSTKGAPGGNVLSIVQDNSSDIWAANSAAGLMRIVPPNNVLLIPWVRLGHRDNASVLSADRVHGGLWMGFFRDGIAYFSDGQIRKSYTTADGLGAGRISDFLFDDGGALWISTEGGLSRLKGNRLATLTSKNGLPCDTVHWAAEGDDHSLWLYTACGLVKIDRSELDGWAAAVDKEQNATRTVRVTVLHSADGVRSLSSPGFYHPQVAKTPDGRLWFIPSDGISVINPLHLPFNSTPPPVHIEQVTADGKTYDASNGLALPPHLRNLTIDYTALSLVVPEKVHFKVKLEGQDKDWRELVNVRHVEYTNLPPRSYRFRVQACNNSGVWSETGASLDFAIAPAYYQTTWFRLLCVAAFAALLWAIYQRRLYIIRRQYAAGLEATVGERMRVARELHDTLLQSFQGAIFQFQAARKLLLRKEDNAMEALDEAILATEEAIQEGRSAIRDLRPEPAAERNLPELLNAVGREQATAREVNGHAPNYRVVIEGKQQDLSPILQDEVYRISREVIRNAFAHAAASHIEVEIRYDQDQLRMRVRDDGKGIDPKVLAGGQQSHFGLPGMRERAQRIGARLDFWSEMGAGTEVELTVPAAMAYQKRRDGHRFRLFRRATDDE